MRTTLTLEPDVAARLRRLGHDAGFKNVANRALRAGLDQLEPGRTPPRKPYHLRPVRLKPLRTDFDNTAEVVAELEGDTHS